MPKKNVVHKRWFLDNPLYKLKNGEEIRKAARAAGVRLVEAQWRTKFDEEAAGKPAEVLFDQYKKQAGSSDSNLSAPTYPDGQEPAVKLADQRLTELHAAEAQEALDREEVAEDAAHAALEAAAVEKSAADEAKAKEAADKKAKDAAAAAAAKAAQAKAEAEAKKSIETKAEIAAKEAK